MIPSQRKVLGSKTPCVSARLHVECLRVRHCCPPARQISNLHNFMVYTHKSKIHSSGEEPLIDCASGKATWATRGSRRVKQRFIFFSFSDFHLFSERWMTLGSPLARAGEQISYLRASISLIFIFFLFRLFAPDQKKKKKKHNEFVI